MSGQKVAKKPAKKAAKKAVKRKSPRQKLATAIDRGEAVSSMEPMLIGSDSRYRSELNDKVLKLTQQGSAFRSRLPEGLAEPLSSLVREMNCYYSNLIEGHNTHPIDIQRALFGEHSDDPESRDLQQEALAHISVQRWIDEGGIDGSATKVSVVHDIHRRFCELLPDSLRWVTNPDTGLRKEVIPGEVRKDEVKVGDHWPISPGAVKRYMERWEAVYAPLGTFDTALNVAAAHHRLLWIHPFLDGNGRVARLISYASLRAVLDTAGLWTVARGLARNTDRYKSLLCAADLPRRNDLDGRGNLSEEALVAFTHFFLDICIDQIDFMEGLMQPKELRNRIMVWLDDEIRTKRQHERSKAIIDHVLFNGQILRRDLAAVTRLADRTARRIAQQLATTGILRASTSREPYRLAFPAELAPRLTPGLYPGSN